MTDDIPLAFAKEVLGWKDAAPSPYASSKRKIYRTLDRNSAWHLQVLDTNDSRNVTKFVREWCDKTGHSVGTWYVQKQRSYMAECKGFEVWDKRPHYAAMKVLLEVMRGG